MSLKLMTCGRRNGTISDNSKAMNTESSRQGTNILMAEMLQKLQFAIRPFRKYGRAKRLHNLLHGDGLVCQLISGGT